MRPKPAFALLACVVAGLAWTGIPELATSQDAPPAQPVGEVRLASSLELGAPFDAQAQYEFEQQLTFDERAKLISLDSRFAIADSDNPLPTSEPAQAFYLKLHEPLSREDADRLTDAGASFVGYAYPHTHFIRATSGASLVEIQSILHTLPVAGTLLRDPMDACSAEAWDYHNDQNWTQREFRILFWRDVAAQRKAEVLGGLGAEITNAWLEPDGSISDRVPYIDAMLNHTQLVALASHADIDWISPRYELKHHNTASASLSNAGAGDVGPSTSYNLTGQDMIAVVFDGGTALPTHNDYQSASGTNPFTPYFSGMSNRRVLVAPQIESEQPGWGINDTSGVSSHPTHVTGTVLGDGASEPSARGFAPEAYGISMGWGSMEGERQVLRHYFRHAADNHSYGTGTPWNQNPPQYVSSYYGGYDSGAQASDIDIRDIWLNMCKSAGNDGEANSGGFTCTHDSCMKNSFTIAATSDNGSIAGFSSRGPTNDGRLIPHFAANGVNLTSTLNNSNTAHGDSSGTSMSSPSACGALTLLTELWRREFGDRRQFAPDELRGILAVTSSDEYNQGPDYRFGFGIIDVQRAADLILDQSATGNHVRRGSIRQGDQVEYNVQVTSSSQPLKVALSWLDIYASTQASTKLVNNLDIELIAPNSSTHYPWRGLTGGGNQTHQWTRNGANNRDNIELVEVDSPQTGTWTIRVTGASIPANPQNTVLNDATGFVLVSENAMTKAQQLFEDSLNTTGPMNIPNGSSSGLARDFTVSNTNAIENVRVYVDVRHPRRGDIEITLRHPDNTTITIETTDTSSRPDIIAVYPDTRQYDADTEVMNGKAANGTWTVTVKDLTGGGNSGTLEYLALEIDYDTVNPPVNSPPTANAGANQTVNEGVTVNLSGSGSSDPESDPLTYQWSQIGGPSVTLLNSNTVNCSFVAPQVSSTQTVTIRLTVDDGNGGSDFDDVVITVNDVPAPNNPPTANAGVDFSVTEGIQGTLNGNGSTDPDSDPLTYSWLEVGSSWLILSNSSAAAPTFIAPQVSTPLNITMQLTVDDGRGGSDTDTVVVTILDSAVNNPPTADAGPDAFTAHNAATSLNGTGSSDPENDTLSYTWAQIGGTNVVILSNSTTATPSFTAPATNDVLVFQLTVNDGQGNQDSDTVTVTVNATGTPGGGGGGGGGSSSGGGGGGGGGCSTGESTSWLAVLLALIAATVVWRRREA